MSTVSDNLRTILNELNMSQTEFADELNISFGYLNMLINGRRQSISPILALLIEKMYGYSSVWLIENLGDKKIRPMGKNDTLNAQIQELVNQLTSAEIKLVFEHISWLETEKEKEQRLLEK